VIPGGCAAALRQVKAAGRRSSEDRGGGGVIMLRTALVATVLILSAEAAFALDPDAQRGQTFVRANCALCHAVGHVGDSPLPAAPPFRTLHTLYPVEDLAESLAEGIITGHPSMPQFTLDAGQVDDVIAYLKTLEEPGSE
jgi:mono/diheme cytochrome c family protein